MRSDVIEQLFRTHYNSALLYTMSLCKNRTVAEDIVSDSFYKALNTADDTVTNFRAWLLTVCRNNYFNMTRRQKRQIELDENIKQEGDAIEEIIRDESYAALYHAISLLPESYREIITLFYFEGLRISDIATVVDKNENTVKVTLVRAREKLKNILER